MVAAWKESEAPPECQPLAAAVITGELPPTTTWSPLRIATTECTFVAANRFAKATCGVKLSIRIVIEAEHGRDKTGSPAHVQPY